MPNSKDSKDLLIPIRDPCTTTPPNKGASGVSSDTAAEGTAEVFPAELVVRKRDRCTASHSWNTEKTNNTINVRM